MQNNWFQLQQRLHDSRVLRSSKYSSEEPTIFLVYIHVGIANCQLQPETTTQFQLSPCPDIVVSPWFQIGSSNCIRKRHFNRNIEIKQDSEDYLWYFELQSRRTRWKSMICIFAYAYLYVCVEFFMIQFFSSYCKVYRTVPNPHWKTFWDACSIWWNERAHVYGL